MVQEKTQKRPQAVVIAVSLFALSHAINDIIRIAEVGIPLRASYFIALTMVWGPVLLVSAATYRVAATFLLFQPAARCWFRSPKKAPMTPAR
jgi:hypothetical protein